MSKLSQISRIRFVFNKELLETVINALVFSKLYYSSLVWSSTSLPEMFVTYSKFKTLSREVFAT